MSWLTLLPVVVMLPIFLIVQGLMIFCITKIRKLVPIVGPLEKTVPAKGPLELYYFHDSCCCQKVRLALEEVGLAKDTRMVHLDIGRYGKYDHLKESHLERNPTACVPVLVHEGHPVLDSSTIIRYVEEMLDGDASLAQGHTTGASIGLQLSSGSRSQMRVTRDAHPLSSSRRDLLEERRSNPPRVVWGYPLERDSPGIRSRELFR